MSIRCFLAFVILIGLGSIAIAGTASNDAVDGKVLAEANLAAELLDALNEDYQTTKISISITGPLCPTPFTSPGNGTVYTMPSLAAATRVTPGVCPIIEEPGIGGYNNYIVHGSIRISRNDRLIVQAGERIACNVGVVFQIEGKLDSIGSNFIVPNRDVVFTSADDYYFPGTGAAGQWQGIRFVNPVIASTMKRTRVEYAEQGIRCNNVPSGALLIEECYVTNCFTGIHLATSSPLITKCPSISGNLLRFVSGTIDPDSGTGIQCTFQSRPTISMCTITANEANGVGIVSLSRPNLGQFGSTSTPGHNNLFGNGQNEVFNATVNGIFAQDNYWAQTTVSGIESVIFDDNDNPASGAIDFSFPSGSMFALPSAVGAKGWSKYR